MKNSNIKGKSNDLSFLHLKVTYLIFQFQVMESKSKPDYVVCPNILCKTLVDQGIPENKIKIISDLQRSHSIILIFKRI